MAPPVEGILETALYVRDLERSLEFYERLFGFERIMHSERGAGLSVKGRQVFLLFERGKSGPDVELPGGTVPGSDASGVMHVAFAVESDQLDAWRQWLDDNDVAIESTVAWGRGGKSIYFRDPDDHVIELVTRGTWSIY